MQSTQVVDLNMVSEAMSIMFKPMALHLQDVYKSTMSFPNSIEIRYTSRCATEGPC